MTNEGVTGHVLFAICDREIAYCHRDRPAVDTAASQPINQPRTAVLTSLSPPTGVTGVYEQLRRLITQDTALSAIRLSFATAAVMHGELAEAVQAMCALVDAPRIEVTLPESADYAFDRALLELAHAARAWRQGRRRLAANHLQRAMSHAAEGNADPHLVPTLYEHLQRAATGGRCDVSEAEATPVVIDGVRHEILDRGVYVALASRSVLRHLLYALLAADGHYLDRNAIAHALWNVSYAPLRHESALKSNIHRLRELLQQTRVIVETARDGYRLSVPPGTLVVPPSSR
jgi:DNA-binding winged helix-turn-helix (wHTH) protein